MQTTERNPASKFTIAVALRLLTAAEAAAAHSTIGHSNRDTLSNL
jgi:hypothetical protein